MNLQQLAGILIIIGFVQSVIAMFTAPRLYQEPNIETRVAIVAANRGRWIISQIFFASGAVTTTAGFLLLTVHLAGLQGHWLIYPAFIIYALGALAGVLFVYRQTFDPARYWNYPGPIPMIVANVVLTLIGFFLYGIVFLQGEFPEWLGYLTVSSAFVFAIAGVAFKIPAFFVDVLAGLIILVQGVVFLQL